MQHFLTLPPRQIAMLVGIAFLAGLIDAIVVGGGLLQLPLLLGAIPHFGTATPLGVNKAVSAVGNVSSAIVYWVRNPKTRIDWRLLSSSGAAAISCAVLGALLAASIPISYFRPFVMVVLLAVLWVVVTGRNEVGGQVRMVDSRRPHLRMGAVSSGIGL